MFEPNHNPVDSSAALGRAEMSENDRPLSTSPDNITKRIRAKFDHLSDSMGALLLKAEGQSRAFQTGIFLVILSPVVLLAVFGCLATFRDLTESTFSKRQAVADLAATALEQRFGRLSDIGVSLATRVRFRQLVARANGRTPSRS